MSAEGRADARAACPACGHPGPTRVRAYRSRSQLFGGRDVVACGSCDFHFLHPMPSSSELAEYNRRYFHSAHDGVQEAEAAAPFHRAVNLLRFRYLARHLPESTSPDPGALRVLELGPGLGDFAEHLLARFPAARYTVIEPDRTCAGDLAERGLRVLEDLEELPESDRFDLVVMSHVLEHLADPLGTLTRMGRALVPRGLLFIEVPCRDFEHKELDEPHLLFFDAPSMRSLLERASFQEVELSYHGRPIRWLERHAKAGRLSTVDRIRRKVGGIAAGAGLVPGGRELRAIPDPRGRAAVWWYQAHLRRSGPAWWLRVVGRRNRE